VFFSSLRRSSDGTTVSRGVMPICAMAQSTGTSGLRSVLRAKMRSNERWMPRGCLRPGLEEDGGERIKLNAGRGRRVIEKLLGHLDQFSRWRGCQQHDVAGIGSKHGQEDLRGNASNRPAANHNFLEAESVDQILGIFGQRCGL